MKEDKVKIPGLKDKRRMETQRNQREARKEGIASPRGLARSVAKSYCRAKGIPESECGTYFRELAKKLPRYGRKYLKSAAERMEQSGRRKIVPATDCSGVVVHAMKRPKK